jgi:ATP-binding cassette subfamily B protein
MISFIKLLPTRDKVMMYILIIFIGMQVTCDLYLPELISKIIGLFELDQVTKEYTYPNPGQIWLAVAYAVMALAGSTIGVLMVGIFSTYISANYSRCIKAQFFNKVMKFSIVDINNFSIASLVNRGINDINGISNTFQYLLKTIITAPAMIVGGALKTLLGSTQNNSDGGIGNT